MDQRTSTNAILAFVFFAISTWITWLFIAEGKINIYNADRGLMLFSCAIAGTKWALQIGAALRWLDGPTAWTFIRRISIVCLAGSVILLPYLFFPVRLTLGHYGFYYCLIASVGVMIPLYYRAVRKTALDRKWFRGWLVCLAVAVLLQITLVFN